MEITLSYNKLAYEARRNTDAGWPDPPSQDAFYGLPGRIVSAIDPHTESDCVAILIQFLIAFGNLIGRTAHFVVDGTTHHLNLFCVLVGSTAISRKGTSWNQVKRLNQDVDSAWLEKRLKSGLSSGEGLIASVADHPVKPQQREGNNPMDEILEKPPEKRLLVIEAEFDSVLQVIKRNANTISAVLRQVWDGDVLSTLTKQPMEAHDAHVSLIGHITRDELRRDLDSICGANGFGNRFMWVCVQRSKSLPHGGSFHLQNTDDLVTEIRECRHLAECVGSELIGLDAKARELWESVYYELTEGKPGLLGAMLARGAPIVRRLACLYCLLDEQVEVGVDHLRAALAVWRYCEQSASFIFGGSLGDPMADKILVRLRTAQEGMTRTDISQLFSKNKSALEIDHALEALAGNNKARMEKRDDGQGRPAEVWFAS
jgi:hypothetical protein